MVNIVLHREHEAAIRQYQGMDPLEPWFNYIQWVEQSYPKHGHEGHIDKLIKDCLQLFEKDERYYQDRRLVKLWIKYVSQCSAVFILVLIIYPFLEIQLGNNSFKENLSRSLNLLV